MVSILPASDSGSPPSPTEMSTFGSRASNIQEPGANLSRIKGLFHIALREDARHALGFQTQSTGKEGEKTQFIKLRFNVLFLVCVGSTNNDSQTVLAKDVTETDVGQLSLKL